MRLRGGYLLVVAASVAAVLTLAGPATAATPDPACGTKLIRSFTLTGDINCTGFAGSALTIGQAGITVNLNGHTITGASGYDVIDNTVGITSGYDGLTVENGTLVVQGAGTGVDGSNGGDGLVVASMTIEGGVFQIDLENSIGDVVTGSTLSNAGSTGVNLWHDTGTLVTDNTINQPGSDGILEQYGTNEVMTGNTLTGSRAFDTGICLNYTAGTLISGNTIDSFGTAGISDDACGALPTLTRFAAIHPLGLGGPIDGYSAGLTVSGNVIGGAPPAQGNGIGIDLAFDSGDLISGNYIRNSVSDGVYDSASFNNAYTGNIATSNGSDGFVINPIEDGPVTMVNNYARLSGDEGFDITDAFNGTVPGGPYSLFSGNAATYNTGDGFDDTWSVGATWTKNTAYRNGRYGFYFDFPERETFSSNSATLSGSDGFYFDHGSSQGVLYQPLGVADNTATLNGGFGFNAAYPTAGSGNTGSNNASGPCHLVAGCN